MHARRSVPDKNNKIEQQPVECRRVYQLQTELCQCTAGILILSSILLGNDTRVP